jgi:hypothetical protein
LGPSSPSRFDDDEVGALAYKRSGGRAQCNPISRGFVLQSKRDDEFSSYRLVAYELDAAEMHGAFE